MKTSLETRLRYLELRPPQTLANLSQVLAPAPPRNATKLRTRMLRPVMAFAMLLALTLGIAGASMRNEETPFYPWRESRRGTGVELTWPGPFSDAEALQLAEELAAAYLADTTAKSYSIDGRPIRLSDLVLVDRKFSPRATQVNLGDGTYESSGPHDLWSFRWELNDYWIEQWGIRGTVFVEVTFDNLTGVTKSAGAGVAANQ